MSPIIQQVRINWWHYQPCCKQVNSYFCLFLLLSLLFPQHMKIVFHVFLVSYNLVMQKRDWYSATLSQNPPTSSFQPWKFLSFGSVCPAYERGFFFFSFERTDTCFCDVQYIACKHVIPLFPAFVFCINLIRRCTVCVSMHIKHAYCMQNHGINKLIRPNRF